ncbi:MAG TPA: mycothiol synthase [Jatrophihabitans sp.]|uniref:mycothiol synthase n=1 Tax=Jatrophihabitans sp. TaxID=1932789 RepID=UPI002DFAA070|nr:mycothiol synthase [Jatrophihabitans sp.]
MPLTIETTTPDDNLRAEIRALAVAVERADGSPPLSDQTLSQLGSHAVSHVIARAGDALAGYAQLDGDGLEIAAQPDAIGPLLDAVAERDVLLIWSHGGRSRLVAVFQARGFTAIRELHQLRRPLDSEIPIPPVADGVLVRTFVPGRDDAAWLALNAAAFAAHAEQGQWTQADLDARMAESWFDADGFLLAERGDTLLGFHWTKVHPDGSGEVYVLGVAPDAQGLGLGAALLARGLSHLQSRGCPEVLLYVDGDNAAAMRLYERDGFTRFGRDVQWRTVSSL